MEHHLLLIRDDGRSTRYLTDLLQNHYTVATASTSEVSADPGIVDSFDLILIDHAGLRISAIDVCVELRKRNVDAPIVVLAAREQVADRIAVFRGGADECLLKPVDLEELMVRIEALLIRSARHRKAEISNYEFAGIRADFRQSTLIRNGLTIELTEREARLLHYLVENRGKTISRAALLQHVWGYMRAPLTRTVDVHILRLRTKIEDNPRDPRFIVTVPGFGYRFDG